MVGGAISGYCETGSCVYAMPPTMSSTIDSTDAKIGRSTKKCEKFIAAAPATSASGGSVTTSGLTLTPGLTRISPLMTTVSSPVRPSRMTR